jgi:selenocysteine lyase/cysteine desulfurase
MSRVAGITPGCASVRVVGADMDVMCADGRRRRYVNLDYAASTPALPEVWKAVEVFLPWYSSVHRGSGIKSQVATEAFERARDAVGEFVGAPPEHDVVFVRNTTEAVNVLAAALPDGARVLTSPVEHHAGMLPWRRHDVRCSSTRPSSHRTGRSTWPARESTSSPCRATSSTPRSAPAP